MYHLDYRRFHIKNKMCFSGLIGSEEECYMRENRRWPKDWYVFKCGLAGSCGTARNNKRGVWVNRPGADSTGDMPLSNVHGNETGNSPRAVSRVERQTCREIKRQTVMWRGKTGANMENPLWEMWKCLGDEVTWKWCGTETPWGRRIGQRSVGAGGSLANHLPKVRLTDVMCCPNGGSVIPKSSADHIWWYFEEYLRLTFKSEMPRT